MDQSLTHKCLLNADYSLKVKQMRYAWALKIFERIFLKEPFILLQAKKIFIFISNQHLLKSSGTLGVNFIRHGVGMTKLRQTFVFFAAVQLTE